MSLVYGCISRGNVILAEKGFGNDNYFQISSSTLSDLQFTMNKKTTVPHDNLLVHTIVEDGLCYLCISNKEMGRRVPYLYLDAIKAKFQGSSVLYQRSQAATQLELNRNFSNTIADFMNDFNDGKGDKLSTLQNQVGEVTGVMKQNIEKVLERGDKLDDLVEQSDNLQAGAATFKTTSKRISRKYYWQNKKMMIIIVIVVIVIVTIIILAATKVI